ncbi:hypothetical protein D6779_04105 [Candidatus Parcubacteria bacterium]|nr:MAG: hypothetical protein D6779_04105 [Candidatus Parcubacteria bacterium]
MRTKGAIEIEIEVEGAITSRVRGKLQEIGKMAAEELGAAGRVLRIIVLPRAELKRIKKEFFPFQSSCDDVLSFGEEEQGDFPHPEYSLRPAGEVYLSREILSENKERAFRLLVHGILHLFGYHHTEKRDILMMQKKEQELWERILSSGLM